MKAMAEFRAVPDDDDDDTRPAPWWESDEPPDIDYELPWPNRRTYYSKRIDTEAFLEDGSNKRDLDGVDPYDASKLGDGREPSTLRTANLISSLTLGGQHAPALDIDLEARLIPSRTAGHYHLYIDKLMPWWKYRVLLKVLAWVGIIEPGYYRASVARRMTFLRWDYWAEVEQNSPKRSDKYREAHLRVMERTLRRKVS